MTVGRAAATVMVEEVLSAMTRSVPPDPARIRPGSPRAASPVQLAAWLAPLEHVRHAPGPEMTDVNALSVADAHAALQRLVHMAEQQVPRTGFLDRRQQCLTPPLHPAGHGVIEQLRHRWRDVQPQHLNLARRRTLGCR